jgi:hypothetical protein
MLFFAARYADGWRFVTLIFGYAMGNTIKWNGFCFIGMVFIYAIVLLITQLIVILRNV